MSTSSFHEEPVAREGEQLVRRWTRKLRDWLNVILGETAADLRNQHSLPGAGSPESSGSSVSQPSIGGEEGSPFAGKMFGPSGPPEAWLKLVREGAPQLLLPVEEGGTPWAGTRVFAPECTGGQETSTMVCNASVDDASIPNSLPMTETTRVVEEPARRPIVAPRPEDKSAPKPTMMQVLESTVTQVVRRYVQGDETRKQVSRLESTQTSVPSTAIRGPIESILTIVDSSATTLRNIPGRTVAREQGVSPEPKTVMLIPKTDVVQEARAIRQSNDSHQCPPSRSEKVVHPPVAQPVATSVGNALQTTQPGERSPRTHTLPRPATNWNATEEARHQSSTASSFQVQATSKPNVASPISIDNFSNRHPQTVFMPEIPEPRAVVQSFAPKHPQAEARCNLEFPDLPEIALASETHSVEGWVDLPSGVTQSPASFPDALLRLDRLRHLDREQQGGN